jgi:hypothetical protein
MANSDPMPIPEPTYADATKAITMTPVVGTPGREYAEMFVPGAEALEDVQGGA